MIFEGKKIVVAHVAGLLNQQKPCYITVRGLYKGVYVRTEERNRLLTPYEVDLLTDSQVQPLHDLEPVERATLSDLDKDALTEIVQRAQRLFPRVFGRLSDETILLQLGALTRIGDRTVPTLAGLLAAGTFPQQFFPRLLVTVTIYPNSGRPTCAASIQQKSQAPSRQWWKKPWCSFRVESKREPRYRVRSKKSRPTIRRKLCGKPLSMRCNIGIIRLPDEARTCGSNSLPIASKSSARAGYTVRPPQRVSGPSGFPPPATSTCRDCSPTCP